LTKKALYKSIADQLSTLPGLPREHIMINLVKLKKDNWSFWDGEAQYA
jgi:phenylpyruvate tautomerase PptA (4-oxalocrotonate tautomerase family)